MADIGEEGALGPVELGERLSTAALGREGGRIGDCRSDMAGGQAGERPVVLIQRPPAVEPGHQEPARPRSGGLPERHHHSPRRRIEAFPCQVRHLTLDIDHVLCGLSQRPGTITGQLNHRLT